MQFLINLMIPIWKEKKTGNMYQSVKLEHSNQLSIGKSFSPIEK